MRVVGKRFPTTLSVLEREFLEYGFYATPGVGESLSDGRSAVGEGTDGVPALSGAASPGELPPGLPRVGDRPRGGDVPDRPPEAAQRDARAPVGAVLQVCLGGGVSMRESYFLSGKRQRAHSTEEVLRAVRALYPEVTAI